MFSSGLLGSLDVVTGVGLGLLKKTKFCLVFSHFFSSSKYLKHLSISNEAHKEILYKKPVQPSNPKRLKVGVIGMPNVGKSTLINSLMEKQILATAKRIDTTQENVLAVLTIDDVQIEFQDTPGIHNKRKAKKISGNFDKAYLPGKCMEEADLVMVVVDLSERKTSRGFLQPEILLHVLKHQSVPSILVMNKIDRLTRKEDVFPLTNLLTSGIVDGVALPKPINNINLEPISLPKIESSVLKALDTREILTNPNDISLVNKTEIKILNQLRYCRGWPHFKEVFVISALKGQRVDKLRTYLMTKALSKPWKYHSDVITDSSPYDVVKGAMRSSLLENLAEELPYYVDIQISDWQIMNQSLEITIDLICRKRRHQRFVQSSSKLLAFGTKRRLKGVFSVNCNIHVFVSSI